MFRQVGGEVRIHTQYFTQMARISLPNETDVGVGGVTSIVRHDQEDGISIDK
jgi:hypothetical protein